MQLRRWHELEHHWQLSLGQQEKAAWHKQLAKELNEHSNL